MANDTNNSSNITQLNKKLEIKVSKKSVIYLLRGHGYNDKGGGGHYDERVHIKAAYSALRKKLEEKYIVLNDVHFEDKDPSQYNSDEYKNARDYYYDNYPSGYAKDTPEKRGGANNGGIIDMNDKIIGVSQQLKHIETVNNKLKEKGLKIDAIIALHFNAVAEDHQHGKGTHMFYKSDLGSGQISIVSKKLGDWDSLPDDDAAKNTAVEMFKHMDKIISSKTVNIDGQIELGKAGLGEISKKEIIQKEKQKTVVESKIPVIILELKNKVPKKVETKTYEPITKPLSQLYLDANRYILNPRCLFVKENDKVRKLRLDEIVTKTVDGQETTVFKDPDLKDFEKGFLDFGFKGKNEYSSIKIDRSPRANPKGIGFIFKRNDEYFFVEPRGSSFGVDDFKKPPRTLVAKYYKIDICTGQIDNSTSQDINGIIFNIGTKDHGVTHRNPIGSNSDGATSSFHNAEYGGNKIWDHNVVYGLKESDKGCAFDNSDLIKGLKTFLDNNSQY